VSERMSDTLRLIINFALVIVTIVSVSFAVIKSNDAEKVEEAKKDILRLDTEVNHNKQAITILERSYAVIENELKHISKTQEEILNQLREHDRE
jgi:septal ring factor EnvC (AmiA/AmiB activator)